ncbi:unnamed protein product [Arabidopsis thaliana]|uniref:Growth-regulating factor 3 n=4 Tax=Arabidopsis TaxID=3701 RepID=GRF3_ARATH|nr:growth-regulating factor 3 [Arabidopsis thaliana]Q9SJR5.1 RecName: Full=Growth-regulating factor 3; Short=AtGRF3; AltName: Full=Transcription activator GRF3 [Arabidopsis thaliana]KAG7643319.1 Glutamine-Leucine-Glutamine QLQ [Arabidopsis suecica]AAD24624.1 unknown protein [Arabidopsis thaliana]AAM52878.1 transcription activator [Arabidopsis thaliana]ABH04579.1 At2g36400 [Arabidopsis thaliana]AEC09248.1 growth-regulating factor 3 [Arabidopsis thaliana]|eukprot:NP_181181.1 growth-regulating factor 3 [Arabidopsis thaliana]
MDLQLKQWRSQQQQQHQTESEEQPSAAKIPKHVFDQIHSHTATSTALPLFTPEPTSSKLSSLSPDSSSRFPKMGSFFSWAQWQELELQALIYRYMLAGAAVPQELLLPIKKSLLHLSPSYFLHHPLQHLPHYQPAWYLGRAAMDPEPGRCRRTDGKKWRCSRDVFAGHKYCERHMHRGRNRSRKPVETPTTVNATATSMASSVAAAATTTTATTTSTFAFGGGGGSEEVVGQGGSFFFSGSSNSSSELLHLSQSCSEMKQESNNMNNKRPYESHIGFSNNRSDGGHILRPFFDDWPRSSLQEADNSSSPMSSATCLSISMPGNSSSDVSLKLSTGNEEGARSNNNGRDQQNMSWWSGGGSNHHHHNMGGPLAEALRSSSSSSPTSVLHQLGVSTQAFH